MTGLLEHDDHWLRYKAAEALLATVNDRPMTIRDVPRYCIWVPSRHSDRFFGKDRGFARRCVSVRLSDSFVPLV